MSSTVTQYVVWDNLGNTVVAGPFTNSADATTALRRVVTKTSGLGKRTPVYTVEQITSVKQ